MTESQVAAKWLMERGIIVTTSNTVLVELVHLHEINQASSFYIDATAAAEALGWKPEEDPRQGVKCIPSTQRIATKADIAELDRRLNRNLETLRAELAAMKGRPI